MRILSLFYGHDANCTLMEDGEPAVVLEKERLTRVKHDKGAMDIGAILEEYGWNPDTIDVVVISPWIKPTHEGKLVQWQDLSTTVTAGIASTCSIVGTIASLSTIISPMQPVRCSHRLSIKPVS